MSLFDPSTWFDSSGNGTPTTDQGVSDPSQGQGQSGLLSLFSNPAFMAGLGYLGGANSVPRWSLDPGKLTNPVGAGLLGAMQGANESYKNQLYGQEAQRSQASTTTSQIANVSAIDQLNRQRQFFGLPPITMTGSNGIRSGSLGSPSVGGVAASAPPAASTASSVGDGQGGGGQVPPSALTSPAMAIANIANMTRQQAGELAARMSYAGFPAETVKIYSDYALGGSNGGFENTGSGGQQPIAGGPKSGEYTYGQKRVETEASNGLPINTNQNASLTGQLAGAAGQKKLAEASAQKQVDLYGPSGRAPVSTTSPPSASTSGGPVSATSAPPQSGASAATSGTPTVTPPTQGAPAPIPLQAPRPTGNPVIDVQTSQEFQKNQAAAPEYKTFVNGDLSQSIPVDVKHFAPPPGFYDSTALPPDLASKVAADKTLRDQSVPLQTEIARQKETLATALTLQNDPSFSSGKWEELSLPARSFFSSMDQKFGTHFTDEAKVNTQQAFAAALGRLTFQEAPTLNVKTVRSGMLPLMQEVQGELGHNPQANKAATLIGQHMADWDLGRIDAVNGPGSATKNESSYIKANPINTPEFAAGMRDTLHTDKFEVPKFKDVYQFNAWAQKYADYWRFTPAQKTAIQNINRNFDMGRNVTGQTFDLGVSK
jgi:hypothetical protein